MKTNLKKFDNSWYNSGSLIKKTTWYFINIFFFKNSLNVSSSLKVFLLKIFGAVVESNVIIKPCVNIKYPWFLKIGANTWIGENVWIDNLAQVTIGKNVCLSQGAMLLTGNHNYKKSTFDLIIGKITLEEGVWIGAKAVVCPGVTCFSHAILTVNSVATKDLASYQIYQGNPAQKIRERKIVE